MIDKNRLKLKYSFHFGFAPHGKERPRIGRGRRMYTPKATSDFEEAVAVAALAQIRKKENDDGPLEGPIALEVTFAFEIPKSYSAKKRSECIGQKIFHTKTPDIDNCVKSLKDGMNEIVYRDDSQVCYVEMIKIYAKTTPYIIVRVFEIV